MIDVEKLLDFLDMWEKHAIRGIKEGATAYHQGKIALICELRDWIKEQNMKIKFKKLNDKAMMPSKAHPTDAGFDLTATSRTYQGGKYIYGTGLSVEIPKGYDGDLKARSSIGKTFLSLVNGCGTIDSDYRGEIKAQFYPMNDHPVLYNVGDRICQLVIRKHEEVKWVEVKELNETERGDGGFGSTGK